VSLSKITVVIDDGINTCASEVISLA